MRRTGLSARGRPPPVQPGSGADGRKAEVSGAPAEGGHDAADGRDRGRGSA